MADSSRSVSSRAVAPALAADSTVDALRRRSSSLVRLIGPRGEAASALVLDPSEGVLLTVAHAVPLDQQQQQQVVAAGVRAHFCYRAGDDRDLLDHAVVELGGCEAFAGSGDEEKGLEFGLVRLKPDAWKAHCERHGRPGWWPLLGEGGARAGDQVQLLAFPEGNAMSIATGRLRGELDGFRLEHNLDTAKGSSGGPVFTQESGALVGLHCHGGQGRDRFCVLVSEVLRRVSAAREAPAWAREAAEAARRESAGSDPIPTANQVRGVPGEALPADKFVGHERELREVDEKVLRGQERTAVVAAAGLPGIGKTELLRQWVEQHRGDFELVVWVRAERRETVAEDLAGAAEAVGLRRREGEELADLASRVSARIAEGGRRCLVVFDNAAGPESYREYVRTGGGLRAHYVVTARRPEGFDERQLVRVEPLSERESLELLRRLGVSTEPEEGAHRLCEQLGGVPLALVVAGALLTGGGGQTCGELAEKISRSAKRLLDDANGLPTEYREGHSGSTMWAALGLAWERLARDSPAALRALMDLSVVAPDRVAPGLLPSVDEYARRDLRLAGLVSVDRTGGVTVHRLVQEHARGRQSDEERRETLRRVLEALGEVTKGYNSRNQTTWVAVRKAAAHADRAAELSLEEADGGGGRADEVLLEVVADWAWEADHDGERAVRLLERVLQARESRSGPEHAAVGAILGDLAGVKQKQGRLEEAQALCERALAIQERALGPEHAEVGATLSNLANVKQKQGRLEEALALYKRALAIKERALGPEHASAGATLGNLAGVKQQQGRLEEAEALLERALAIQERALGPEHASVGATLGNLAGVKEKQGRLEEAAALYERALAIQERALGPEHASAGATLGNLAVVKQKQGRLEEAEALFKRALAIKERALGPKHAWVSATLCNLAGLKQQQGRLEESARLAGEAASIIAASGDGPACASRVRIARRLQAQALSQAGLSDQAVLAFELALSAGSADTADAANIMNSLAYALRAVGRLQDSLDMAVRARSVLSSLQPSPLSALAFVLDTEGDMLRANGRSREALGCYREAVSLLKSAGVADHRAALILASLADTYDELGELEQAAAARQEGLRALEGHSHGSPETEELRRRLSRVNRSAELAGAAAAGLCSFTVTGREHATHEAFECSTCFGGRRGMAVCGACAARCHRGHSVARSASASIVFYCDCGAGDAPSPCQCLVLAQAPPAAEEPLVTVEDGAGPVAPPTARSTAQQLAWLGAIGVVLAFLFTSSSLLRKR